MKLIIRIFGVLSLILGILTLSVYLYLLNTAPKYNGELSLKGLKENVEVYFDEYGIPHIYAQNEEDAYFALGYVHAQDRLFQMEMIRRVGSGRLAEILGEKFIENDKFFRTAGIVENAKSSAKKYLSGRKEPYQKAAFAYLDGLNTFIEKGTTPIEFTLIGIPKTKFTPEDLYCITGFMAFGFADAFRTDPLLTKIQQKWGQEYLNDLAINTPANTQTIPVFSAKPDSNSLKNESIETKIAKSVSQIFENLPVSAWIGSNSWVIAPSKTESGKVIFANDAHIGYSQPSVWYEAHLEAPNFSFYGNHLAGIPFGVIGHTREIAWGMTMFENDDIDFFEEKINPNNPNQVWAKDRWENLKIRDEEIKVKGKASVKFQVKTSRHGAIINEAVKGTKNEKNPIAMWWMLVQEDSQFLQSTYAIQHAKNIAEVRKAASSIHAPGLNLMYGDKQGNIAWWASAKLVKYPPHVNTKLILDGASGKDDNIGFYDFTENPQSENPPTGFVYSANNQPDTMANIWYPGYYLPENRAKRIVQLLSDKNKKWNTANSQAMITDVVSAVYPDIAKAMIQVIEKEAITQKSNSHKRAIEILKSWNGDHQLKDIAPTLYYKWAYTTLKNTFKDELGEDDFRTLLDAQVIKNTYQTLFKQENSAWFDDKATKEKKETRKEIFIRSFEETIIDLEKQLGNDIKAWHWEKVHILIHEHVVGRSGGVLGWLFNVGPFGVNGGSEVINNMNFKPTEKGFYKVNAGPSKRIIIDFADIENAYSINPTGQSGNLMSPFYSNQAKMYAENKFRKMMMNKEEIQSKSKKLVLKKGN